MFDPDPCGRLRAATVATLLLLMSACSGSSDSDETTGADPTAGESAEASPEAFLEHAGELLKSGRFDDYAGLYFAETDEQAEAMELVKTVGVALARLDQAMRDRYGDQHDKPYANPCRFGAIARFSITERETQRAKANVVREDGASSELYLIETGGRWRISCFTEEYDARLQPPIAATQRWLAEAYVSAAGEVTADVRAGRYASIDEARAAYEEALSGYRQAEESRIYIDQKYHFRVVAPPGWTRLPSHVFEVGGAETRCGWNPAGRPENIVVFVQKLRGAVSAEGIIESLAAALPDSAIIEKSVRDVAGKPAACFAFTAPGTGAGLDPQGPVMTLQRRVAIPRGSEVLVFLLTAPASNAESARRAFEGMLDSLVLQR